MKKTISTNRLTIDLTDENKSILEGIKNHLSKPFGTIVNTIISTFCDSPKAVNDDMLAFCKKQLKILYKQMDTASPFEFQELSERAQAYINMATLLNNGVRISIDELKAEPDMTRYEIEGGYVICPEDWIVLNPEMAKQCIYAGVVECRRKDYHVPHFLFFTNKTSREYDAQFCNHINQLCCKAWPEFIDILRQQVEPIDDADGNQLNVDEWMAAPHIGHFALHVQGSNVPPNYKPPFGAMVVHK